VLNNFFYIDKLLFFWRKRKEAKENTAAFVRLASSVKVKKFVTASICANNLTLQQALGNAAGYHIF